MLSSRGSFVPRRLFSTALPLSSDSLSNSPVSSKKTTDHYDVVIVGAGHNGLTAVRIQICHYQTFFLLWIFLLNDSWTIWAN